MSMVVPAVRELRACYAFIERSINLARRGWPYEAVVLAYLLGTTLSVLYIVRAASRFGQGARLDTNRLLLYLTVGALVWSYLFSVFNNITETFFLEGWEGTIESTLMAPVHRLTHLLGISTYSILNAVLRTAIVLLAISLLLGVDVSHANAASVLVVILLSNVSIVALSVMAALLPLLFTERGYHMAFVIWPLLLLVSGVYYPIDVLPPWMQMLGHLSPALYALDGMRAAIIDGKSATQIGGPLIGLGVCGVVSLPLSLMLFGWAERYAKRSGRLKRSG